MRFTNILTGGIMLATLSLLSLGGTPVDARRPLQELQIGVTAPLFSLSDTEGQTVSLADILERDAVRAVVVEFMATRCPVSQSYDQRMVQMYADYQDKGVVFLGINSNCYPARSMEDVAEVKAHKARAGIPFPVLKDFDSKVADAWGARVTPHMYVLCKAGKVRYMGAIDDSQNPDKVKRHYLRDALDAVLAGDDVKQATTKAFGCTIKRKT